jgi:hypothetical protein
MCEGRRKSKVAGEERSGEPEPEQVAEPSDGGAAYPTNAWYSHDIRHQISNSAGRK